MLKHILPVALICATTALFAQPQMDRILGNLQARQIGPATTSGRITAIDAVHRSPEIIYVGTAGGGLWKTTSGGAVFLPVFDEYCQSIGKVAIDQNHPDTVWVGAGEPWVRNSVSVGDGIYRTTNGGKAWEHLGLKNTERISDIVIHPSSPNTVFVAAQGALWSPNPERGVFKTSDGGKTWGKILYIDEHTGAADLDMDPKNPDILYATLWSHRRYPDFFDSGLNGNSGVYKSTDGGKTWNKIHQGLPKETLGRMAIAVAPGNGEVIYLTVECKSKEGKGLYLSTDQGASWAKVSNEFNAIVRPFYFSHLVADPENDSIVMKAGLSMIVSENRGKSWRPMNQSVHSDVHAIWIDPNNTKHLLIGTDGGVYESFDRGSSFKMFMNLPVGQFYHVGVDNEIPFNVYGGLQDNGSWYAPSRKPGGIANSDWKPTFGGDGFWSFPHPANHQIVFAEYQGGNLVRFDKKTGLAKEIRPFPSESEPKFRFNWNAPIHISPTNPNRMYFGAQFLFRSDDMGDSWKRISPDLSTNDLKKQRQKESGGLSIDNSGAENHCTIYAIAESPVDGQIVWAGTDDGNLQVSANGGQTWTNVAANIPGLPAHTWVANIEPSHFNAQTAYATFDGHRTGDMETYVYKTTDLGKTWVSLSTPQTEGYAFCIKEDLVNAQLLFLGTELGLFISLDGGKNWGRFSNNLPKVAVHDMVIHPRDHSLVLATHGRGIAIIDNISPLRQITADAMNKPFQFLNAGPAILRDPEGTNGWYGGNGLFLGPNPSSAAQIIYYMSKRHTFGKMYIEVWKDGQLLKTLPAGKSAGINIVEMPTTLEKPKTVPSKNIQAIAGNLFGPNFPAGDYQVKVVKDKSTFETTISLIHDPQSPFTPSERSVQKETTMKLYALTETMAYQHEILITLENQARKAADSLTSKKDAKLKAALLALAQTVESERKNIVSTEGDGYVNEDERLVEQLGDLYRQVSTFPGKPTDSQVNRAALIEKSIDEFQKRIQSVLDTQVKTLNGQLAKSGRSLLSFPAKEEFLSKKDSAASASGGNLNLWMNKFRF